MKSTSLSSTTKLVAARRMTAAAECPKEPNVTSPFLLFNMTMNLMSDSTVKMRQDSVIVGKTVQTAGKSSPKCLARRYLTLYCWPCRNGRNPNSCSQLTQVDSWTRMPFDGKHHQTWILRITGWMGAAEITNMMLFREHTQSRGGPRYANEQ
jgi:hypothetical protein